MFAFFKKDIFLLIVDYVNDSNLTILAKKVKLSLGNDLKKILLFGSRARSDFHPDSDYDFSCSRANYSVFYILESLLLTKDLEIAKLIISECRKYLFENKFIE